VVDDEPVQRKMTAVRFRDLGYTVETAPDGEAALAQARHDPPDVIISDVLMPKLDGFGLCRAVRQDPRLAKIPVVLASSSYVDQEDHALAIKMGADRCVTRTPDLAKVIDAVEAVQSPERAPPQLVLTPFLTSQHLERVVQQLERQVALTASLAGRNAHLAAQLAALEGVARALAQSVDLDQAAPEILAICLEAGGVSQGAFYLRNTAGSLVLRAVLGFVSTPQAQPESFFGHTALLEQLITAHDAVALPSAAIPESISREIMERTNSAGFVIATVPAEGQPRGALVMGSHGALGVAEEWLSFARVVGTQLGYLLTLMRLPGRAGSPPDGLDTGAGSRSSAGRPSGASRRPEV
jgi:CheY-like chemotaxis protein